MLSTAGANRALLALVSCLLLVGCASPTQPSPAVPSTTPTVDNLQPSETPPLKTNPPRDCVIGQDWSVTFRISGGLAGIDRRMALSSDGSARLLDVPSNTEREVVLEEDVFARIANQLTAICPTPVPRSLESCPDCFNYAIELRTPEGLDYSIRFSDDARLEPKLEALVQDLRRVTDELLR